jgi:hypothetical protein
MLTTHAHTGVRGGRLDLHGESRTTSWTRLARTAWAGDMFVVVRNSNQGGGGGGGVGWRPGDIIVVSSTEHDMTEAEECKVCALGKRE